MESTERMIEFVNFCMPLLLW